MATTVEIPGVGEVEFPDGMSPADISKAAAGLHAAKAGPKPKAWEDPNNSVARDLATIPRALKHGAMQLGQPRRARTGRQGQGPPRRHEG